MPQRHRLKKKKKKKQFLNQCLQGEAQVIAIT